LILVFLVLIESPFFCFGILWLAFRLSHVYANSVEKFATKHPTLSGNLWLGAAILFASVLFAMMLLLQR